MDLQHAGKNAILSGSTAGIGLATAERRAQCGDQRGRDPGEGRILPTIA